MDLRNSYLMDDLRGALATGMVCPTNRQMIAIRALPDEFEQPFEALRTNASDAIKNTNDILQIWLEKGRRANRFSEEYIKVSRRIEKMVTTMGRGLITLHMQGEDLSKAPVSIEDLLDIASYHFNKSCNGAKAAAESNPEVFERLMLNQLCWVNMLLRLERTRERLNEKVIPGKLLPAAAEQKAEQLPGEKVFKAIEAVAPVSGLGAVKALKPLVKFEKRMQDAGCGMQKDRSHEALVNSDHYSKTLKNSEGKNTGNEADGTADEEKETLKKEKRLLYKDQGSRESEKTEVRLKNTEDYNNSKIKENSSKSLTNSKEINENDDYELKKHDNEDTLKNTYEIKETKEDDKSKVCGSALINLKDNKQKSSIVLNQAEDNESLKKFLYEILKNKPGVTEGGTSYILTKRNNNYSFTNKNTKWNRQEDTS